MPNNPGKFRTHVFSCLILLILTVFLHSPLLEIQGFMPKDDWKPLKHTLERPYHPQLERNVGDFGFANLKWEWDLGRFTPVFNAIQVLEAQIFRKSPLLWHLETLVLALCSAVLLYMIFIRLGVSVFPSLLGGMWLLARGQELWVEKQYQEEIGVLFLLAAVLLFIKAAKARDGATVDWAAAVFLVLAGLTKETFVFLYPAVLLFRIFLDGFSAERQPLLSSLRRLRPLLISIGLIFSGQMLLICYLYLNGPYTQGIVGGLFDFNPTQMTGLLFGNLPEFSYFLPALGLLLMVPAILMRRMRTWLWVPAALILALWLVPQFFIFKTRGLSGHYIYSAIPGLIAVNVLGLEFLWRHKRRWSPGVFLGICLFSLYTIWLSLPVTRNVAEFQVARANAYHAAVEHSMASLRDGSSILLVSDRPWWGLGISFLYDLSREGKDNPVTYDFPDPPSDRRPPTEGSPVGRNLLSRYFPLRAPEDGAGIDVVLAAAPLPVLRAVIREHHPWFDPEEWDVRTFREDYSRFESGTVFHPAWIRAPQTLAYTVFVRRIEPRSP